MKDSYNIRDYQHMASGHNTAQINSIDQCTVGRDLVSLGKILLSTTQDAEGLEATWIALNAITEHIRAMMVVAHSGEIGGA